MSHAAQFIALYTLIGVGVTAIAILQAIMDHRASRK